MAALELLDLVLAKWPEPFELSCVYWQKATCHERLGDLDSAAEDFRKAIEAEEMPGGAQTGARKDFLWFIATNKLEDLYPEAFRLLESTQGELRLPIDSFRVHGAAALILEAQGKLAEAARHAESALEAASLEESGYRYHRQLGLVGAKHEDVVQHLRNLTET